MQSLILSHLDYCNSILIGLPNNTIQRLQRIQNMAAKLILGLGRMDSAANALLTLHWLNVKNRIKFKVILYVHQCLNGCAAGYLSSLLTFNPAPTRRLRSNVKQENLLIVPYVKCKTFADRSFSIQGLRLWNSLPEDICDITNENSFKQKLKTLLLTQQSCS